MPVPEKPIDGDFGTLPELFDAVVAQAGEVEAFVDGDRRITFAEWGYLGKGKFQRRDFRLHDLAMSSTFGAEGSLFAHLGKHELFTPTKVYAPMTVSELAASTRGDASKEAE